MREQILNPITKRWVYVDTKKGKELVELMTRKNGKNSSSPPKLCGRGKIKVHDKDKDVETCICEDSNKINNPSTSICVLKTGMIGKAVLKQKQVQQETIFQHPIERIDKKGKTCPPNKITNPTSGICVLKKGEIGKKLLLSSLNYSSSLLQIDYSFIGVKQHFELIGCTNFATIYVPWLNKNILLLGEEHTLFNMKQFYQPSHHKTYLTPMKFLTDLFHKNLNILFDLYLESDQMSIQEYQTKYEQNSVLPEEEEKQEQKVWYETFLHDSQELFTRNNKKKKFPNIRIHSQDIRRSYLGSIFFLITGLIDIITAFHNRDDEEMKDIAYDLLSQKSKIVSDLKDFSYEHLTFQSHIQQHLIHLPKKVQTVLIHFYRPHVDFFERRLDIPALFDDVQNIQDQGAIYFYNLLKKEKLLSKNGFLNVEKMRLNLNRIMEFYVLTKILDDHSLQPASHNIIIYQGKNHITNYLKLFKKMNIEITTFVPTTQKPNEKLIINLSSLRSIPV